VPAPNEPIPVAPTRTPHTARTAPEPVPRVIGRGAADHRGAAPGRGGASRRRDAAELSKGMASSEPVKSSTPASSKFDVLRLDKYLMPDVNFLESPRSERHS